MDNRLRGNSEKKLSTILKSEKLEVTMKHKNLLKVERPKDGKAFVLFKVDSNMLVPKIEDLIKIGLFWGVKRVLGSADTSFAELVTPQEVIPLSCVLDSDIEITESQLGAIMAKLVKSKNSLLMSELSEVHMKPELVFMESSGKIHITAIDTKGPEDMFSDVVAIFRALLQKRTTRSTQEDGALSKTLLDLISLMEKISKLGHAGSLSSLHPKHREIWEKVVKHAFIKQKLQGQALKELYAATLDILKAGSAQGRMPFEPLASQILQVDRITWRAEDLTNLPPNQRLYPPVPKGAETSDSSGGSSNSHPVGVGVSTIELPENGSQEMKQEKDRQRSLVFQEACRQVIEGMIQKTKRESSSNFLVGALENLLQTLISCEEITPTKTEKILAEILQTRGKPLNQS